MNIIFATKRHPAWHQRGQVYTRGHAFSPDGSLHEGEDLCRKFSQVKSQSSFQKVLEGLDGSFCVIIAAANQIFAAVDRMGSMPLFWLENETHKLLTDDPEAALNAVPCKEVDHLSLTEYLLTSYATGPNTLQKGLYILPAGQILHYARETDQISRSEYYRYEHVSAELGSDAELFKQLDLIHQNCVKRLIQSADGRPIAIPLSGGYDSRMVALMLKRLGYKNVSAFCYGDPRSNETSISKAVAQYLEIPWTFVEHRPRDWYLAYQSPLRQEFYRFAGHFSSRPHIQDWLAVRDLQHRNHWHPETIFVPGHSGDFIEGSYIPPAFVERNTVSKDLFLDHAIQRHYRQWPYDPRAGEQANAIRTKIAEQLKLPEKMSSEEAASHFETFYWLEQQPKFILNSMRVYEFFGLEWRLPWWDKELLEYWKRIPMAKRAGREFYKRYVSALRDTGFPVYKKESLIRRMEDRVIRQRWGYLYESRWSRFADLTKDKESRSTTVQGLLPQGLDLPAFVNPKQRIVDTDINGLQSLVAVKEWWEEGHRV